MVDTEKLKRLIDQSGFKHKFIAQKLAVDSSCFSRKINNKREFKSEEIKILCGLLKIDSRDEMLSIFFTDLVDLKST